MNLRAASCGVLEEAELIVTRELVLLLHAVPDHLLVAMHAHRRDEVPIRPAPAPQVLLHPRARPEDFSRRQAPDVCTIRYGL